MPDTKEWTEKFTQFEKKLSKEFGLSLPSPLREVLLDLDPALREGANLIGLATFSTDERFPIVFLTPALIERYRSAFESPSRKPHEKRFLPLCTLSREQFFIAVDPAQPELPAYVYTFDSGYTPCASSLDAVLKMMLKKGEENPISTLKKLNKRLHKAYEKKDDSKMIELTQKALQNQEADLHFVNSREFCAEYKSDYQELSAGLWNWQGVAHSNQDRNEEAERAYRTALEQGSKLAILNLAALMLKKGQLKETLDLCKEPMEKLHPLLFPTEWTYLRIYSAVALFTLGRNKEGISKIKQVANSRKNPSDLASPLSKVKELLAPNHESLPEIEDLLTHKKS